MPKSDVEIVEARNEQSKESKRATFDLLKAKPRAKREVTFVLPDENGDEQNITMMFRAIGATEYDKLISKHPPTIEQRAEDAAYNINTFGPALLSKVCIDPDMSPEQWGEIWNSPDWNRGEVIQMFLIAQQLCNKILEIPFTESA